MIKSEEIIAGVELIRLISHADDRGTLIALEERDGLPFAPRRIFFISVSNPSSVRAGHASSSDELIIAAIGAVTVAVDNGEQRKSVRLEDGASALWVRSGILLTLKDFSPDTVLAVAAPQTYEETVHIDHPDYFLRNS